MGTGGLSGLHGSHPQQGSLYNSAPLVGRGWGGPAPPPPPRPPPLKDWAENSSWPSADQKFSLTPSAPNGLDQQVGASQNSAPPGGGGGGGTPPTPLKGALPCRSMGGPEVHSLP